MIRLLAIHSDKLTPDGVEVMMSTKLDTKITQNLPTIVQVAHSNYKKIQQAKYTVLHSEETFTPIESSSTDSLRNTNKHENEHPKHLSIVRSFPASAESQHQNPTISRNLRLLSNQTTENIFVTTDTIMRNQFCYEKPDLAPRNHLNNFTFDQRIQSMMNVIEKLSTSQLLHDFFSHQYNAACHIVFDDVFGNFSDMNLNEEKLIQRYAMVVFLYSMKQEEALPLPMDICDFAKDHIECNSKGQVTKIDWRNLGMNSKGGTIPVELAHFVSLEYLNLVGNNLEGTIPKQLGRLRNLRACHLGNNDLTGTFPMEIGDLFKIEVFSLNSTNVGGTIPPRIGNWESISLLDLSRNNFVGTIPPELFDCTEISIMKISDNHFTGTIPTNINQLQKMTKFHCEFNNLTGPLPSEVGDLSSLQWLILDTNKLTGSIPQEIGKLESLTWFYLSQNLLTGTLPDIFGNLPNLKWFYVANNQLEGTIPNSFWEHDSFSGVRINNNNLFGTVPDDFCETSMSTILVDRRRWFIDDPEVVCKCCEATSGCSIWIAELWDRPNLVTSVFSFGYWGSLKVTDQFTGKTTEFSHGSVFSTDDLVLSPTGGYTIERQTAPDSNTERFNFTYNEATKSLAAQDEKPAAVHICNTTFDMDHPRRLGLNHLTQVVVADLSDVRSTAYKALCWILNDDKLFEDFSECDGTLLQRYVMILFYLSYYPKINLSDLALKHTCHWPNVKCTPNGNFIERLMFPGENLQGTLVTEIGLIGNLLKILDLSNNELAGDPTMILSTMPNLEVFNIGNNNFEGTLPKDVLQLSTLRQFNASHNRFVGALPNNIKYAENLESFDIGNNLLQGKIAVGLFKSIKLTYLNLSQNNFFGNLPKEIRSLMDLRVIKFDQNSLSGSIPFEIFHEHRIEEVYLQSNLFTGTIPTDIGSLSNATIIAMSHNQLQGTIPTELENLHHLELLHLHHNQLTGVAPKLEFEMLRKNTYVTDCGDPSFLLSKKMDCPTCTMCCNSEEMCQVNARLGIPLWSLAIILACGVPIFFTIQFLISKRFECFDFLHFGNTRDATTLVQGETAYCFLFTRNKLALTIDFLTTVIQVSLFYIYVNASNKRSEESDWQYSVRCPSNSLECNDENSVSIAGWILFAIILFYYLAADLFLGVMKIRRGVRVSERWMFYSGLRLVCLSTWAIVTSVYYNLALAEADTDLIMNAVILTFINDLDEQIFKTVKNFNPQWVDARLVEIDKFLQDRYEDTKSDSREENNIDEVEVESGMVLQ